MSTHAFVVTGNGGTAADAVTQIGDNITLPAGGPWIIHGIWGQVVRVTTVPNEGAGGIIRLDTISGDITPQPAPAKFPLIGACVAESANAAISAVPLNIFDVLYNAAGKATAKLSYINDQAITTASKIAAGIIFGDSIPIPKNSPFCDSVQADFASAAETQLGTITLAEKATRITGILADLNKADAVTVAEEIMATIRLGSPDIQFPPAQYPCCRAFNASDGTAVGQSATPMALFIPVDIPVIGGARVDVFATTTRSVTGNASVRVFLKYE